MGVCTMKVEGMKQLEIRRFTPSDLSRILEIERVSFSLDAFSERTFMGFYHECSDLFVVAEMDGKIVGYMITCSLPEKGYVASIAVDPVYRHKKVGRTLANFSFKQLRARDVKVVELEVRATNKEGIGFWKTLGFLPLRRVPRFYEDGEDALKMRKILKEDSVV